ncbi:uncharacterized protein LOC128478038 [Spea bombifrons]|uniref:uncharacterized protein LOC128478038 n=1 Tax=Spea bombifrons TaxID=233779 RepID=UPI00234A56BA|nr:uncharacterized protein LOC128478038 [Spea bombifrons]XP_053314092.1 uncharacterized protein LOC128478038 [Spea bombifrons]
MPDLLIGRVNLGTASESNLAAAAVQVFAVVAMSTAMADPRWMQVDVQKKVYVLGVAEALHLRLNFTGSPEILKEEGMHILIFMTFCCYGSIFIGFLAFMLDFLDIKHQRILGCLKCATILHFITVLSTAAAVGLCIHLYLLILHELKTNSTRTNESSVVLGESFAFAIFSGLASFLATVLSCVFSVKYVLEAAEQGSFSEDDEVIAPLIQELSDAGDQQDVTS